MTSGELVPSPENGKPSPMYDVCSSCKIKYQITPENAAAYFYKKQPECSYVYCICPNCDNRTRIYVDMKIMANIRRSHIAVLEDDWADDDTYKQWLGVRGIELPREYGLSKRQEKAVADFGRTLRNIPDELFWDNIEAETERPYNEKWIDD